MKKIVLSIFLISFWVLMTACNNDEESSKVSDNAITEESTGEGEASANVGTNDLSVKQQEDNTAEESNDVKAAQVNRKIIYTAHLQIQVKNYQKAVNTIQSQVTDRSGYIVESNMYGDKQEGSTSGQITVRIPQDQFREFIQLVEKGSSEVIESSISGQDVTEEYVDLESRLKSKRVVEERLLSFMEQAKKTEDLLTISEDLANVQGEIEEITGRMKFLQNKADLASVTISIQEKNIKISGISEDELNTWEKTKQQFLKSINFLLSAFSGIFVFLVGNLPILVVLGVIGLIAYLVFRKTKKKD
ncbi:DUF4349 domain-containing protein [Virgibacillus flavescens]|uniref:DUF4349 domain-containing protein n=1 Tax=Virgibacillus flavescens TaxID=1611422 RepID=UPI003D32798D